MQDSQKNMPIRFLAFGGGGVLGFWGGGVPSLLFS